MANNILEMALEQLDFPPSTISAWFDDVTVVSFGDNRLVLHSPVPFKKEFIESKFIAPLQEVLHNLIRKAHHFVLDRRTVARTGSLNHSGKQWRTAQIIPNDLMCLFVCISQITGHLIYLHILRVCGKGKWNNFLISKLFFHFVVILSLIHI